MTRTEYARTATYFALGVGLLAMAALYAQAAVWPLAAAFGIGSVAAADAGLFVQETARERRLWGAPVASDTSVHGITTTSGSIITAPAPDVDYEAIKAAWQETHGKPGTAHPVEVLIPDADGQPVCVCTAEQLCLKCRTTDREQTHTRVHQAVAEALDAHQRALPFAARMDLVRRVVNAVHPLAPAAEGTLGNPRKGTL